MFVRSKWLDISLVFIYLFKKKEKKKKKKNSANIQPFWPHAWSIAQMNIFHADPYKYGKGRQYKKYTSELGICLT